MKPLFTFFLSLFFVSAWGQPYEKYCYVTFDTLDTTLIKPAIIFDTNYANNKWQIGIPHKTVFTSGYNGPIAIVTDTSSPCIQYDTSVFAISFPVFINTLDGPYIIRELSYWQMLDMDMGDMAIVDKKDYGSIWDTVRKDTVSTPGWQYVQHHIHGSLGPPPAPYFRFSFITDSSIKNRDGWMIDSIRIMYVRFTGIEDAASNGFFGAYPNPAHDELNIVLPGDVEIKQAKILDIQSRVVGSYYQSNKLNISDLSAGLYFLQIETDKGKLVRRFLKE